MNIQLERSPPRTFISPDEIYRPMGNFEIDCWFVSRPSLLFKAAPLKCPSCFLTRVSTPFCARWDQEYLRLYIVVSSKYVLCSDSVGASQLGGH